MSGRRHSEPNEDTACLGMRKNMDRSHREGRYIACRGVFGVLQVALEGKDRTGGVRTPSIPDADMRLFIRPYALAPSWRISD